MNTLDTPAQMDTAHTNGYITEFKEKSEFEQRINTAWRRAEHEAVKQLAESADISPDLDQKVEATTHHMTLNNLWILRYRINKILEHIWGGFI